MRPRVEGRPVNNSAFSRLEESKGLVQWLVQSRWGSWCGPFGAVVVTRDATYPDAVEYCQAMPVLSEIQSRYCLEPTSMVRAIISGTW